MVNMNELVLIKCVINWKIGVPKCPTFHIATVGKDKKNDMIKNYWTYNKAFLLIVIVFAFGCIDETKEKTKLAGATSVEKNQMQLNIIWFGLL